MKKLMAIFAAFCIAAITNAAMAKTMPEYFEGPAGKKLSVMFLFSGLDWCGPCQIFDKDVIKTEEFKKFAKENLALFEIDTNSIGISTTKVNGEPFAEASTKEAVSDLKDIFHISGVPTAVIINKNGDVIFRQEGAGISATDFIANAKVAIEKNRPVSEFNSKEKFRKELKAANIIKQRKELLKESGTKPPHKFMVHLDMYERIRPELFNAILDGDPKAFEPNMEYEFLKTHIMSLEVNNASEAAAEASPKSNAGRSLGNFKLTIKPEADKDGEPFGNARIELEMENGGENLKLENGFYSFMFGQPQTLVTTGRNNTTIDKYTGIKKLNPWTDTISIVFTPIGEGYDNDSFFKICRTLPDSDAIPEGYERMEYTDPCGDSEKSVKRLLVQTRPIANLSHLNGATVGKTDTPATITLHFNEEGAKAMAESTKAIIAETQKNGMHQKIAIIADGEIICAPGILTEVSDCATIDMGNASKAYAANIAKRINKHILSH